MPDGGGEVRRERVEASTRTGWGEGDLVVAAVGLVAYLAAAVWARHLSLPGPSLIWFPPAAVAIGLAYVRPAVQLPVVVVGELLSTALIMGYADEYGPVLLVVNAVALSAAYGLGGEALRRLRLDPELRSARDLGAITLGALAGSTAATVLGIATQRAAGIVAGADLPSATATFWVGDAVAATCLLPALVLVGAAVLRGDAPRWCDDRAQAQRPTFALELVVPAVAALVLIEVGPQPMRFAYLAFVPIVLLAVRHGVGAAAISNALLAVVMTAGAHLEISSALIRSDFQLLLVVLTVTSIVTGAIVSSRYDVAVARGRVVEIVEATPDLVATATADGRIRYLNPAGRALLGVDAVEAGADAFDLLPDDLAAELMREGIRGAERAGTWTGENRLRGRDGREVAVSQVLVAHPHPGEDGQPIYSSICRDLSDRHDLEDQLRRAALYDEATSLPNRALLLEQLERALADDPEPRRVAVLFADLDHLQHVNETLGFAMGDRVVGTIAERLATLVRGQDLVARHGGSQFVLVLADLSEEFDAILLADRLLSAFAEPIGLDGHELRTTGSVGIALATSGQDHLDVLRAAEIALHRAKEAGGGRFALFDQELQARAAKRLALELDLREVLTTEAWTLAYQPIWDIATRRVVSVEALLRWTHPERGPVSPFELIRLAEWSGSIVTLGSEIFRRACRQARQWHEAGFDLAISINVSARQLQEEGFADEVAAVIAETGIAPDRVVVELTETVLAGDEHGEVEALEQLRRLGCKVALDDFGTGYSTLGELRHLPIDIVKLDQRFLIDLADSPRAAAVVEAAVRLAHALDLVVVAEGVEQDEQLAALDALGCERVQGFVLSPPLRPDELVALLEAGPG